VVVLDEDLRHQAGRVGGGGGCRLVRGGVVEGERVVARDCELGSVRVRVRVGFGFTLRLTLVALTWLSMLAASMCAALASAATCSAERLADDHAGRGGEGFMVHTAPDSAALASSESLEPWLGLGLGLGLG